MNDKRQQRVLAIATIVGLAFLAACNPPAIGPAPAGAGRPGDRAGQTGRRKRLLADARVAAKNAEQAVNDVAAGVKQGLDNKSTPDGSARLDLNSASEADLTVPARNFRGQSQADHRPSALHLLA